MCTPNNRCERICLTVAAGLFAMLPPGSTLQTTRVGVAHRVDTDHPPPLFTHSHHSGPDVVTTATTPVGTDIGVEMGADRARRVRLRVRRTVLIMARPAIRSIRV